MAWFKRHPSKRARGIFNSDRGSQYASKDYRDVLTEYGITASMPRSGDCWDNAWSDMLFGSLKVERQHGQRFKTRRHAMDEVIAWRLRYAKLDCTRHWPTSVRCSSKKTVWPSDSVGYGLQGQGHRARIVSKQSINLLLRPNWEDTLQARHANLEP
jgi:hypothetical protein